MPHVEHLEGCVPALPGDAGCPQVREHYLMCPDHDGWCAPGCPVGAQLIQQGQGTPLAGGTTYAHHPTTSTSPCARGAGRPTAGGRVGPSTNEPQGAD